MDRETCLLLKAKQRTKVLVLIPHGNPHKISKRVQRKTDVCSSNSKFDVHACVTLLQLFLRVGREVAEDMSEMILRLGTLYKTQFLRLGIACLNALSSIEILNSQHRGDCAEGKIVPVLLL